MRKILENFYYGNIRPSENQIKPNSELLRAVGKANRCEQQLKEQLSETGQMALAELIKAQEDIDGITACDSFILGFRLGVRMMAECMDEDDGNTRKMTDHN